MIDGVVGGMVDQKEVVQEVVIVTGVDLFPDQDHDHILGPEVVAVHDLMIDTVGIDEAGKFEI